MRKKSSEMKKNKKIINEGSPKIKFTKAKND